MTPLTHRFRAIGLVAALAATASLTACGSSSDDDGDKPAATGGTALFKTLPKANQDSGEVSFGALWETPPIISVTASDTTKPVGLAPDLAAALGEELGVKATWQNMQWPAQLPGVQSGVVDALFGQVNVTEEREQSIVDMVPFYKTTMALLLPAADADGVTKLGDMCGTTIGAPVGSETVAELERVSAAECASQPVEIKEFQGATLAISAVKSGSIDAWLDTTASQVVAADADGDLTAVEVPEDEIAPVYNGIAVGKDKPELTKALVEALRALIESGRYDEIFAANDSSAAAITVDEVVANPITSTPVGEK
ncbi:transporter substrate-binding domain-containing protein [Nocardioides nitrophenolicus]|uniref:transporter substrate-binding domain-containing protein n=1 Tax=Nocardioides nitrophenolicus TaxID=60489 RepID=UPI00195C15C2|nr:transporter substrate-binding domain-containing protein [Nocardioides nitrophenolicus]MBM7518573.1 ABC-type amino acid transport substrate-binding protein [Nocardioides nitrophenolicus]